MPVNLLLTLCLMILASSWPAQAQDSPVKQQWKEQEIWTQFTERENGGNFPAKRRDQQLIKSDPQHAEPSSTEQDQAHRAPISMPVIIDPGAASYFWPANHVQATFLPPSEDAWDSGNGSRWGTNFGPPRYGTWRNSSADFGNWAALSFRPRGRVVQTRPSKSSGNYFQPSTFDPSASGSYFAPTGNAPRVMPVYLPEPTPKDFWGRQGSPLPREMQPD